MAASNSRFMRGLTGCGGGIIRTAMNGVLVAVGIAQMLVAAVQIRRVLRVWRASSRRPELRGRVVLVVAVWAAFGLLGLVWLAQGLSR
jgi:F0F1-type ATP synthase membrane subunit c/vacuolar-type H+-ATPase subunit K